MRGRDVHRRGGRCQRADYRTSAFASAIPAHDRNGDLRPVSLAGAWAEPLTGCFVHLHRKLSLFALVTTKTRQAFEPTADRRHHQEESRDTWSSSFLAPFRGSALWGLGGAIAVAQASDNTIKQTVNSVGPKIVNDENAVTKGLQGYPQGKVTPLTRALQHEVGDLHALKSRLSHESASSASGAEAKTDIIKGLGLIASAYAALRKDVLAANGGPVPAAQVTAAVNRDKEGRKKLQAGLKLLAAQPKQNPTTPTTDPTPTPTPTPRRPVAIR